MLAHFPQPKLGNIGDIFPSFYIEEFKRYSILFSLFWEHTWGCSFKWFIFFQTHTTLNVHLMYSKPKNYELILKQSWTLTRTWSWRSEQARGEGLSKAWPWLHTTLFVPCIISVNSECCTVNTWMDSLARMHRLLFQHMYISINIYTYIFGNAKQLCYIVLNKNGPFGCFM